jgi:hypothetical protein
MVGFSEKSHKTALKKIKVKWRKASEWWDLPIAIGQRGWYRNGKMSPGP